MKLDRDVIAPFARCDCGTPDLLCGILMYIWHEHMSESLQSRWIKLSSRSSKFAGTTSGLINEARKASIMNKTLMLLGCYLHFLISKKPQWNKNLKMSKGASP